MSLRARLLANWQQHAPYWLLAVGYLIGIVGSLMVTIYFRCH